MMQLDYDRGFDRSHPHADRIFRVDLTMGENVMNIHARALVDAIIASSPHIEAGTLLNPYVGKKYVTTGEGNDRHGFREKFVTCYPEITGIFGFSFVEGDAGCLADPEKVIIPRSMALRMFGDEPAVGKAIASGEFIWTKEAPKTFTVGGVYRDFPGNTQLDNAIYTAIDRTMQGSWNSMNFICYILSDGKTPAAGIEADINGRFDFSPVWNPEGSELSLRLKALPDIYLYGDAGFGSSVFKSGSAATIRTLMAIALLIIIIAGVNFTNFSIAMAPSRVKSINTQKVLGGSTAALRSALVIEALVITLVSWAAAVFIVDILDSCRLLSFMEADMKPAGHPALMLLAGVVALATGLIAGLYPAWYVTSFRPAVALKSNFALSPVGRKLRTWLTGFQFAISIGLIVAAGFVQLQNNYMRAYNLGFDKDRIVIVELGNDIYRQSKDAYANTLREHSGIEDVAFARQKVGAQDEYATYTLKYGDRTFGCYVLDVSHNFAQVMGIGIVEGRDFLPTDEQQGEGVTFIFNKPLQDDFRIEPGSLIDWQGGKARTAGIAGDLKFTSLRTRTESDYIALITNTGNYMPVSFIRIKAGSDVRDAVSHIRRTLAGIDPSYPFDIEFYDDIYHHLYSQEEYLNRAITLLSLLAIIISMIGVFGLVVFETEYRRREISLRKVFGSTTGEILLMFNRTYFRLVCVCFVITAPLVWYAVSRWLENFAYRTPIYWWVYGAAFALVTLVTAATVTFQTWQAANTNPIEGIRTE
jgi:putative ABC transport system permease protein